MGEKNEKVLSLEATILQNRIQIELDKKQIADLKQDLNNLSGGFQVCKSSVVNVLNKFNAMFPEYKVEEAK